MSLATWNKLNGYQEIKIKVSIYLISGKGVCEEQKTSTSWWIWMFEPSISVSGMKSRLLEAVQNVLNL